MSLIRGCATGAALCREAEAAAGSRRRESGGREGQGRRPICRARGCGRRGDRAASRRGRQRGCGRLFAERHAAEEAAEAPDSVEGRVCDDHRVGDGRGAAIGARGHCLQPGGRGRAPQTDLATSTDSFRSGSFLTACCCAFAELGAGELQGGRGLLRHRREPQRLGVDWYMYQSTCSESDWCAVVLSQVHLPSTTRVTAISVPPAVSHATRNVDGSDSFTMLV